MESLAIIFLVHAIRLSLKTFTLAALALLVTLYYAGSRFLNISVRVIFSKYHALDLKTMRTELLTKFRLVRKIYEI